MRAPLLVGIYLSALGVAQAGQSGTFEASIDALTPVQRDKMIGRSWHEGCPAPLDDLVSIRLDYIGFDDAAHDGVLVAHRRLANEIVEIFSELFAAGFKIERMQPYEDFPVGEYAASNDTVGFYCRPAQDDPKVFSSHAYGISVDINPMTNPYHDPRAGGRPAQMGSATVRRPGFSTPTPKPSRSSCGAVGFGEACSIRPTTCISARSPSATKAILCSALSGQVGWSLRPIESR